MWRNIGVTRPKPTRDDLHTKFHFLPRHKQSSASQWQLIKKADEPRGRNMGSPCRGSVQGGIGQEHGGWRHVHPELELREPIAGRVRKIEP
jgi:hypothetical protein